MSEQKTAEEKAFAELKWRVGLILAQKFLEYNDGKFHAAVELNPATHALTEFIFELLAAYRESLGEMIPSAEWKLKSTEDYLKSFEETIETEPDKFKKVEELKVSIEKAKKLLEH